MKWLLSKLRQIGNVKKETLIKNSFLLPILSVVIISISHVISWYDLGNPMAWAIYLSVAVEIFALASVSAASIKIKKGSIWALFGLVTIIQIVGNVFFTYKDIDVTGEGFLSWVELIGFWFEDWDVLDHRRFLAYIQGGTLPFMSLIALHFYIKFNENLLGGSDDKPSPDDYYDARNRRMEEMVQAREAAEEAEARRGDNKMAFDTSVNSIDAVEEINKILVDEINTATEKYKKSEDSEESKAESVKATTPASGNSTDDIVTKVTPQINKPKPPAINDGQAKGHRKPKENPGMNPQILPGTN
jgi:hypothetical protein